MIPWWVALISFYVGMAITLIIVAVTNAGKDD